jgi:hypothetical protein
VRRLPIDTSAITFAVAEEPRRLSDFETKQPKVNENGEQLFSVSLLATSMVELAIISVKVPGLVAKLGVGEPVKVTDLVAMPWSGSKGAGVSFSASQVEPVAKVKAA